MKRLSPFFIPGVALLLTAVTCLWLFATEEGLCCRGWTIQPNPTLWPPALWMAPLLVYALAGGLAAAFAWLRFRRARTAASRSSLTWLPVAFLALLGAAAPWALYGPEPAGSDRLTTVVATTYSDVTTHFFELAYRIDNPRRFTAQYADRHQTVISRFKARIPTHPPGTTLFYYAVRRSWESLPALRNLVAGVAYAVSGQSFAELNARSRALVKGYSVHEVVLPDSAAGCALWCAFLLSLAAGATVPAVYLLGAGNAGNEARGLLAAALFALSPSVGLFSLGNDVLVTFGAAWSLWLVMRYLDERRAGHMAAAGALVGLTSFFSFGALPVLAIAALTLLLSALASPSPAAARAQAVLRGAAWLAGGFVLLWLALVLLFPMQPLRIYFQAMEAHHIASLASRGYWEWFITNPIIFALFAGWAVSVPVVLALLFRSSVRLPGGSATMLARATLLTILLLMLSGKVRGEIERLWMFLLPALCVAAASVLLSTIYPAQEAEGSEPDSEAGPPSRPGATPAAAILAFVLLLQAAQSLSMAIGLSPLLSWQ